MVDQTKDRVNFPGSPACGQWETLLVDALDGLLRSEDEAVFSNHMATCSACAALFEEARRGQEWLEFLAPEPEVPAHLLDKILAGTGHGLVETSQLAVAGASNVLPMPPVWQRRGFMASMRKFTEPRLMMTAAMAFFSIALTLSLTGVRISSINLADLRPTSVKSFLEKRIMTASTPVIRYYDHLRFVYEVESRMRELRRSTEIEDQTKPKDAQPSGTGSGGESHRKDGGSKLNPSQAPQQTVNPPAVLWSEDHLEARLEPPQSLQRNENKLKGSTKPTDASGLNGASGLEMPEWSKSCVA